MNIKYIISLNALVALTGASCWGTFFTNIEKNLLVTLARTNNLPKVKEALHNGANVNATSADGTTALMWAAYNGNFDMVNLLLSYKPNVDAQDINGTTALMMADEKDNPFIIRSLLYGGANRYIRNHQGKRALENVIIKGM